MFTSGEVDVAGAEVAGTIEEDARKYIHVGLGQRHPWRCTPPQ